jgi:hypothetical protein
MEMPISKEDKEKAYNWDANLPIWVMYGMQSTGKSTINGLMTTIMNDFYPEGAGNASSTTDAPLANPTKQLDKEEEIDWSLILS